MAAPHLLSDGNRRWRSNAPLQDDVRQKYGSLRNHAGAAASLPAQKTARPLRQWRAVCEGVMTVCYAWNKYSYIYYKCNSVAKKNIKIGGPHLWRINNAHRHGPVVICM